MYSAPGFYMGYEPEDNFINIKERKKAPSLQQLSRLVKDLFPGFLASISMDLKSGSIQLEINGRKLKAVWGTKKDWALGQNNTSAYDAVDDLKQQIGAK